MSRLVFNILFFCFVSLLSVHPVLASEPDQSSRIYSVVQQLEAAYREVRDYTCEVEQLFYDKDGEDRHFRFKYYFKREKKIRVDFTHPYTELTLIYQGGDEKVTVLPIRFLSFLKLRFSINDPSIRTLSGQRIDQTDMGFFIEFLAKNVGGMRQEDNEFLENADQIRFPFRAMDYVEGRTPEKYRIHISKKHWLPVRLERYDLEGNLLEISIIQNYVVNSQLQDDLFNP
jgi:outer membrane lipoprotein-sorting protein